MAGSVVYIDDWYDQLMYDFEIGTRPYLEYAAEWNRWQDAVWFLEETGATSGTDPATGITYFISARIRDSAECEEWLNEVQEKLEDDMDNDAGIFDEDQYNANAQAHQAQQIAAIMNQPVMNLQDILDFNAMMPPVPDNQEVMLQPHLM